MPTPTYYTYSIQNDFLNHIVASDRLSQEISSSNIVIALNYINTSGDSCYINFKDILSDVDKSTLDYLISIHTGQELPNTATPVEITENQSPVPIANLEYSGYYPDPSSYPVESSPPISDAGGNQQIRGPIFTDEGSFRDDFGSDLNKKITGSILFTNGSTKIKGVNTFFISELNSNYYIKYVNDGYANLTQISVINSDTDLDLLKPYDGYTGYGECYKSYWLQTLNLDSSINTNNSIIELNSGTLANASTSVYRKVDYLPVKSNVFSSIYNRNELQCSAIGFLDSPLGGSNYNDVACFYFSGNDNTKVTCCTSCDGYEEIYTVNLPSGLTSENKLFYKIELTYSYVTFLVNNILISKNESHIPKPYTELYFGIATWNYTKIQNQTSLQVDVISILNHDQLQIGGSFLTGEPLPIQIVENSFTLTGILETNSTESDQIIISTIVPNNKMLFITGYCISSEPNSVDGNPIKIGKNDIINEFTSPGKINSNFFRVFRLGNGNLFSEDFSANPRFLGTSNDVIKITVSPNGSLTTKWRATLDYVIR